MESKGNVRKAYISCIQLRHKLSIVLCVYKPKFLTNLLTVMRFTLWIIGTNQLDCKYMGQITQNGCEALEKHFM